MDPLDGTTNFAWHSPLGDFYCSGTQTGNCCRIIYDPIKDELFSQKGGGSWLNEQDRVSNRTTFRKCYLPQEFS